MKHNLLEDKFTIFKLEIDKSETRFKTAQERVNNFKRLIDEHKLTCFIGEFDHCSHTKGLDNSEIKDEIVNERNVVFCFGTKLPAPEVLAVRSGSIGTEATETGFTISFVEAPMVTANETIESWIRNVANREAA
jgi:hypothetical protein